MIPTPGGPYDHKLGYRWAWVYLGWDGIWRRIDRDGTVTP